MKYFAGKTLPGEERRTFTLDYQEIAGAIGNVCAGTLNIFFHEDLDLGVPTVTTEHYDLWACDLATEGMIRRDEAPIAGFVIRVHGEDLPANFAEVLSKTHIRTSLKKTNWPSFPIELALKGVLNLPDETENQVKLGCDAAKRVRNASGRADST